MQILSGKFKGRKIKTVKDALYRPTKSIVRKGLFDILGSIENLSFLDLYAGSGILGFEAASRGCSTVVFVENDRKTLNLLKTNAELFKDHATLSIIGQNVDKYLNHNDRFDLIVADPPYGKIDLQKLVEDCLNRLNSGGTLVVETRSSDNSVSGIREKRYGDTKLIFWRRQ